MIFNVIIHKKKTNKPQAQLLTRSLMPKEEVKNSLPESKRQKIVRLA